MTRNCSTQSSESRGSAGTSSPASPLPSLYYIRHSTHVLIFAGSVNAWAGVLFKCSLCDADYVGYTTRHLHQRIAEHKFSAIGKHLSDSHGDKNLLDESQFCVLRKCQGKFDCLINEMLFIKKLAPSLNTQSDSIRAKLFVWLWILLMTLF
jgi:hypothetical protein